MPKASGSMSGMAVSVALPMSLPTRRIQHAEVSTVNRFDPSSLTWTVITGSIVVRVGFAAVEEATAFAKHFAGRLL
jgi:hypothetical protein